MDTMKFSEPSAANGFLAEHIARLQASLKHWTGRELIASHLSCEEQARRLFHASFVLVSHNTAVEPVFNYGNRAALTLWEMTWDTFTALPSRHSAEPIEQQARARLLAQVTAQGYLDNYSGIRIASSGRRFLIEKAIIWNLLDENNGPYGQAAMFSQWILLPAEKP
jgi:hypothetical protein